MINYFACNKCSGIYKRNSNEPKIKSFCEKTGKNAVLELLPNWKKWIDRFHTLALGKFKYPDGTKLTAEQIERNFNEGLIEAFKEGLTPKQALEDELEYSEE